ncbi:MAG: hypothetical protein P1Q69_17125 [Candidatus Thorarchaeota archaeon]|nr:hypothetical protein [Candidatus Thorarchaeota archaeon]
MGRYVNHLDIYVALFLSLCFLAFVAPVPVYMAAETYETLSRDMTIEIRDIIPGEVIPIEVHKEFQEQNGYSIGDVNATAVLDNGNLTFSMTIRTCRYDAQMGLISNETTDCKAIIPDYSGFRAMIMETANQKSTSDETESFALAYSDWGTFTRYYWRDKLFVSAPGNDYTLVFYDHPDNYYTYHREQWNLDWNMYSASYKTTMQHYSQAQMNQAMTTGSLFNLVSFIALLAGIAEATVALWLSAILAGLLLSVYLFTTLIVLAEQGDGWAYLYGPGDWPLTNWWWVSFGRLRDSWWLAIF